MIRIADVPGNRAAAEKLYKGQTLTQNEERSLKTARNQAGEEGKKLNRIVGGESPSAK